MAMSKNGQKRLEKNLDEKADSGRSEKRLDIKASEQETGFRNLQVLEWRDMENRGPAIGASRSA